MVEPRPPFSGRRRLRMHNLEENPELVSPDNKEQLQTLHPAGRRRHHPNYLGEELREVQPEIETDPGNAPQFPRHRRSRFHSSVQDEGCATCSEVEANPDATAILGRRHRRLEDSTELPDTLGIPEDAMPRRRRAFNQAPMSGNVNLTVPATPPVPEPLQQRSVRGDSLLESIIKLVNSILSFKGK